MNKNKKICVVVVILLLIAACFCFFRAQNFSDIRDKNKTSYENSTEGVLLDKLLADWTNIQNGLSAKAGESGTFSKPTKIQFISEDALIVYYDDGLVDHLSVLKYKDLTFVEVKNIGVKSSMTLGEWQTLVREYGDQDFSPSSYARSVSRNGKLMIFGKLTAVPENVFVRGI